MSDPRLVVSAFGTVIRGIVAAMIASVALAGTAQAAPPGAMITNEASLDFLNLAGQPATFVSNPVSVTVAVTRSSAAIEFTRVWPGGAGTYQEPVGPSACLQGGVFQPLPDPTLSGGIVIDPTQVHPVVAATSYNLGDPLFLRLVDSDQNVDYQVVDTVAVTLTHPVSGDTETVQLSETGADTGVFVGYLPTAIGAPAPADCVLQGSSNSSVEVDYADPADAADTAQASALLDPTSVVFESRSGTAVDAVQVEIVDAETGAPALVYGNDGVSQYPSSIQSGSTVTDSSGATYAFAPGEYRFPVVPDGDYRLVVTPPPSYAAPSSVSIAELQLLPGAPYALGPGSFGAAFTKSGLDAFDIDLPIDPQSSALFLQKRTLTTTAAPGDFVRYELSIENASQTGPASDVVIVDQMPSGMRFVAGSVTINGVSAPDPSLSPDGLTLVFDVGMLDDDEAAQVAYVVEIVGGQRGDELVNTATASAGRGLFSNEASVAILLTEDLFRSTGTIIGRVLEGDCSQETFREEQGVANIRVYLEDGRYALTDAGGRYHFEGVEAGTHVAQLDTFTVPNYFDVMGCATTPGYAGAADSQFVKLSRGGLHRADFYLRRKEPPRGRIDIEMRSSGTDSAERVRYDLLLNGVGNVEIDGIGLAVLLPGGVSYVPGSLRKNGQAVGEPRQRGAALSMALDGQFGNWTTHISFVATIENHIDGELVTKAVATFDTPMAERQTTPLVETRMIREPAVVKHDGYVLDLKFAVLSASLSAADMLMLDRLIADWEGVANVQISAVGHSDSQRIAPRNHHLFADNYVLSRARAMAAAAYVADALDVPVANIQVEGRGPDEPVADNATAAGRQKNRRVEMLITGIRPTRPSFLDVTQETSGTKETETVGAIPGEGDMSRRRVEIDRELGMPASQKVAALDSLQPGIAMLHPERGFAPAIPATRVAIQHRPDQAVEVRLNGAPVNTLTFAGVSTNAANTVAISRWDGVTLADGANEFTAMIRNADGSVERRISRTIHYSGGPMRGELVVDESTLVADGKTRPLLAVRLFDRAGKPARTGVVGNFRVNAPYRSAWDEEKDRKNALVEVGERSATYQVTADGIALLELAPTTQTGEVTVVLPFQNYREQEIRAWLKPAQRDWILVGFAEGTAAHKTLSDNLVAAGAAGHEEGYYDEGRVAFFAKGSIKGEYLLTLAYDSDRDRDTARDRFDTVVDPNAYYSLYADKSEQRFDAASQRKIYLKLERNQFYALFGDYDTGLSITDLARYERRFNGLKSEYRGRHVGYTAFAAETDQAFNRDEMRGDGTSGLYRLSNVPIIANSEQVRIEVRDRFDSGVVLSSRKLSRFLDYTLDTLDGGLYFKQPVPSRDLDFNPVYIVVEYESVAAGTDDVVAGGRGSLQFADGAFEVGVTHISDETQGAGGELTGVDVRWQINDETLIKAEVVDSESVVNSVAQAGAAQSMTLEHNSENVDVRAFIREVEDGFGLGYQSAADAGMRRLGIDARGRIGEHVILEGEAGWQQNLASEAIRNLARAQLRYENEGFATSLGMSHAEDEFDDGEKRTSQLAEFSVSQSVFDDALRLRATASMAINEDATIVDYPERYVLGADYQLSDDVDFVVEHEQAEGTALDASMTRVGVRASPWSRAQLNSFVTSEAGEFGPRLFANLGLVQGFQVGERWALDFGVDRVQTIVDDSARRFDPDRELPSGSGSEDFTAVFAGAAYTSELWSANARLETRDAASEDRVTALVGWYREPVLGHGLSAALTVFTAENTSGNELAQGNLRFGWAYRVADSRWSFLDRVDLVYDRAASPGGEEASWRLINNFNANRRISAATQLSLQYAFKYVRSTFDEVAYTGYTDLVGVDLRHGFRERWDVGAGVSVLHSYQSGVMDYGLGVDIGYNLGRNIWLSLGYNFAGFEDDDFAAARYTAAGPFLRFSFKADQHLLRDIVGQMR
jgi:uncharacterized repeat protein (TIGR01451 family)